MIERDHLAHVAYLEARRGWTFGFGPEPQTHDCVRWAAGSALALTGRDLLAAFGRGWTTEAGAARVISRAGGMAEAVSSVLTPIDPRSAQRGDWGLTATGAIVVFEGDGLVGLDRPSGYVHLARADAVQAWSLG